MAKSKKTSGKRPTPSKTKAIPPTPANENDHWVKYSGRSNGKLNNDELNAATFRTNGKANFADRAALEKREKELKGRAEQCRKTDDFNHANGNRIFSSPRPSKIPDKTIGKPESRRSQLRGFSRGSRVWCGRVEDMPSTRTVDD